jgi:hypothetical protein
MNALITTDQIRCLQSLRRKAGLDDDTYKSLLKCEADVTSTKHLTVLQGKKLIEVLKHNAPAGRRSAKTLSGPFASKLRALWLAAWNLGIARSRDDAALLAFIERQTGLTHDRFLRSAQEAARVIEALKSWIAREGGVAWPKDAKTAQPLKIAVLQAQLAKLTHAELTGADIALDHRALDDAALDALQARWGHMIRQVKKEVSS